MALRSFGRQLVAAVPTGWLLLFFLVPFVIILGISFSQYWNQTLTYGTQHYDGISWFAEAHVTSTGEGTWAVDNSPPSAVNGGHTPANAALISTVTPTLSVPAASDPNGDPVQYNFITCTGGTSTWNPAVCTQSGYQSSPSWTVPAGSSRFRWSQSTTWWVVTSDGVLATEGARVVATAQRTPATHPSLGFGVQPNMRPVVDVNTGNGNHHLAGDVTFGISVYGVVDYGSYWYPGGLDLELIPPG